MPSLVYGSSAYLRATGSLPPFTLINMFVEKAATSENDACLQSRPGLIQLESNGSGPINKIFCNAGTLSGADFSVSGTSLYKGNTLVGNMPSLGSGPVSMAGSNSELLIAAGGTMYHYNGTTLTTVAFPDSAPVTAVCFIGSMFVAVRGDTTYPGRYYWSNVLDGTTWQALNYATAEREADGLLDIAALNDKIILYGQSTVEVWSNTGSDANLPFTRIEGIGSQSKGIKATGAQCEADNTKFHVGSDGVVYRLGNQFDRISEHWLEEKIAASTACLLFMYRWQGHEFVCVRLDSQTFQYDCATSAWSELQTNGGQFIGQCAAMKGTTIYLGHQSTGQVMGMSGWTDLGVNLTREFTAGLQGVDALTRAYVGRMVPMGTPVSVDNLWLWAETGQTAVLTGQGSAPMVEMQSSRDAGNTWSEFEAAPLGGSGQYRTIPAWRRLGQFDAPGALFRFRVTDPVGFRLSAAKFNEPLGGRSRS